MGIPVRQVNGIGPKSAEYLASKGINTVDEFLKAGAESIAEAPGFSPGRAEQVYTAALEMVGRSQPAAVKLADSSDKKEKKAKKNKAAKKADKPKKKPKKDDKKSGKKKKKAKSDSKKDKKSSRKKSDKKDKDTKKSKKKKAKKK